jgi:hypothetical protein
VTVSRREDLPGSERDHRSQSRTIRRMEANCPLGCACRERALANSTDRKASSERSALKPYWGKPAVRNFRGGYGNRGIIQSPLSAMALLDFAGFSPWRSVYYRIADIHVSQSQEKSTRCLWRALESAHSSLFRMSPAQLCLSAVGSCHAEPDIHLLSQAPRSRHRRLSLCSLPVPKQFVESLESLHSVAQSATGGTWQPAHR